MIAYALGSALEGVVDAVDRSLRRSIDARLEAVQIGLCSVDLGVEQAAYRSVYRLLLQALYVLKRLGVASRFSGRILCSSSVRAEVFGYLGERIMRQAKSLAKALNLLEQVTENRRVADLDKRVVCLCDRRIEPT